MDKKLLRLKLKYNEKLKRNKKAEEYFNTHTIQECRKQLQLFNEVVRELSVLKFYIELLSGEPITDYKVLHGFEEVK